MEAELAIAKDDLIAGLQASGASDLFSVQKRPVLRCNIVEFTAEIAVNQHGTVSA